MPIVVPRTWPGVRNRYAEADEHVRAFFDPAAELIERYPWHVALAHVFSRLELGHNKVLYAGVVKMHRVDYETAHRFVDKQHISRKGFAKLFKNIFGGAVPAEIAALLTNAERIRDRVMHGKDTTDPENRRAMIEVLEYAARLNDHVYERAAFRPFSINRRGYTGRRQPLDAAPSAWLMKGLGFGTEDDDQDEPAD